MKKMKIGLIEQNGKKCAVVESGEVVITDVQSALDLLMSAKYDVERATWLWQRS